MNTRNFQWSNCPQTLHLTEAVWITFVSSCKSAADAVAAQRKMRGFDVRPTNLRGIPVRLFAMNTTKAALWLFKSP